MSYLGVDITALAQELDLKDRGEMSERNSWFEGFNSDEVGLLVDQLRKSQIDFLNRYGLVHGDMFTAAGPNNIVYNNYYRRLYLVDAEALGDADEWRIDRFEKQIDQVAEWMHEMLYV